MESSGPEQLGKEPNFDTEYQASQSVLPNGAERYYHLFQGVNGTDPVLAVINGEADKLPEEGYLINANVAPRYGAEIIIHGFKNGLDVMDTSFDDIKNIGSVRFGIENPKIHQFYYFAPGTPEAYTDLEDAGITYLSNGGIFAASLPVNVIQENVNLQWSDYKKRPYILSPVEVNRVSNHLEEISLITEQIAKAMYIDDKDSKIIASQIMQQLLTPPQNYR